MSTVSCQVEIPEIKTSLGTAPAELTVGRQFLLQCEGEWPELNLAKTELRLEEADKYKLQLLDFQKSSSSHGQLLVVSYKAGEHHLKAVQVVDPDHSVVLSGRGGAPAAGLNPGLNPELSFTVKSVLNPQEPETEPFGPMGPIIFGLSWWYFAVLAAVVLVTTVWIGLRIRRRSQKKKLIQSMKLTESALLPMPQLSQKLRQILRHLDESQAAQQLTAVDEAFRIYFARRFQVPTMIWSEALILKDFKKNFSWLSKLCGADVANTFIELGRARKSIDVLKLKDLEQMIALVRKTSEKLEQELSRTTGSGQASGKADSPNGAEARGWMRGKFK